MIKKKEKLFIALLMFITGLLGNIVFSTAIYKVLIGKMKILTVLPLKNCIASLASDKNHLALFLCLQGFVVLTAAFYYVANNKPYQSNLIKVTENISTPASAGQKQFGSARWLTEKEKEDAFESFIFNGRLECSGAGIGTCTGIGTSTSIDAHAHRGPLKRGGMVLGKNREGIAEKIFFIGSDVHTLCIGATRSGKTRVVVLESIGILGLAGENMIISDPKGELHQYTSKYLEKLGYEVICVDFKNPLKSNNYNFLQPVIDAVDAGDIPKASEVTWDITSQLVGEAKGEKIWRDGEASIIASSIMSVVYDNKDGENRKYQNMTNVYFFISEMCKTVNGTMPILEYMKNLKQSHPARALLAISEVAPSKTRGSFYTAALTTLRLFTNPLINSMTNSSDYRVADLDTGKKALFIILPDEKTTYYSLASLFVAQHYELLVGAADSRGGHLQNRINFICDEFGNFAQIPDFANKLTVGGGRGIRFNLFLQSFSQLDEKYGKDTAKTIKGNCENWIYLQTDDPDTLEEISKKLGNYTVSTYSLSASHGKYTTPSNSHSVNLTSRALLSPDEVRLISRPFSLYTSRNHPAIMYAPDLSKWQFNKLFGLGDEEHNRQIRESRENERAKKQGVTGDMELWNVWQYYTSICEQMGQPKQMAKQMAYGAKERQTKPVVYNNNSNNNSNDKTNDETNDEGGKTNSED